MKRIFLLTFSLLLLVGCGSTSRLTTSWVTNEVDMTKNHFKKVMVVPLLSNKNRSSAVSMEQHLVQQLVSLGINAVGASQVFEPRFFEQYKDKEHKVLNILKSKGIDGVVTIAMISKARKQERGYEPYTPYYTWWGYYSYWNNFYYRGGYDYVRNYNEYTFETNLYDLKQKKQLVYSAHTETTDPSSAKGLGEDYAQSIVEDFLKKGILK